MRLSSLVSELQSLGDSTAELDAVQKMLRVVPSRYGQSGVLNPSQGALD
jgi:hypothetical protein